MDAPTFQMQLSGSAKHTGRGAVGCAACACRDFRAHGGKSRGQPLSAPAMENCRQSAYSNMTILPNTGLKRASSSARREGLFLSAIPISANGPYPNGEPPAAGRCRDACLPIQRAFAERRDNTNGIPHYAWRADPNASTASSPSDFLIRSRQKMRFCEMRARLRRPLVLKARQCRAFCSAEASASLKTP